MSNNGPIIKAVCSRCHADIEIRKYSYNANVKKNSNFICHGCAQKRAGANGSYARESTKLSERANNLWSDEEYRAKVATSSSEAWTTERKALASQRMKIRWSDPAYRQSIMDRLSSPEVRQRMVQTRLQFPVCSSLQRTLYSVLDDLNVKYFREYNDRPADPETAVGPWTFDCVIPRNNRPTLLVECHGNYHHSQPKKMATDKAKATYITSYFYDKYELKVLWEHEFGNLMRIRQQLEYWLDLQQYDIKNFDLSDVTIRKANPKDYRLLLTKYHYLHNAGRGGEAYGAYFEDDLIAVCVMSSLSRQNIDTGNVSWKNARELSRFCIHPNYQRKNFGSWFISRVIKKLDQSVQLIISYADTTYNHHGALYKSCNFKQDRVVPPDYWYVSIDGWVMHKRTLYAQANSLKMTETEFANHFQYQKVWGQEKLRYVYYR